MFAWPADGSKLYASAIGQAHNAADWVQTDTVRFGIGDGDPIVAVRSGQGANLLVLTQAAAYAVDTTDPVVANWTVTAISQLAGCAAPQSAVMMGQDLLFLTRYGVVSLGSLADQISINAATSISAPVQPIIDRINWSRAERIHAVQWRDLYLLALPLDLDEWPTIWLPFSMRTRRWQTPWKSELGGIIMGDFPGQSIFQDEDGTIFINQAGAGFIDSGTAIGPLTTFAAEGWCAGVVTRFGGVQETVMADAAGRLLRIDPTYDQDDATPDFSQEIRSWVTLKSHHFDLPENPKQPFWLEVMFYQSTATGVQINYVPDQAEAFPTLALANCLKITSNVVSGDFGVFPIIFPLVFRRNSLTRKRFHLRSLPRAYAIGIQLHSPRGRMRLRSVRLAAFVDTPDLVN